MRGLHPLACWAVLAASLVSWATACGQSPPAGSPRTNHVAAKEAPLVTDSDSKTPAPKNPAVVGRVPDDQLPKTEAEWRKLLTPQQYFVLRQKGTDRAFTGEYTDTETPGTYRCAGCGEPLFASGEKFHSGCGWPSFTAPIDGVKGKMIAEHNDQAFGMIRTEVTCRRCGAHLGHVFDDGPPPTGLRYCINSTSITLDAKKPEPAPPPK